MSEPLDLDAARLVIGPAVARAPFKERMEAFDALVNLIAEVDRLRADREQRDREQRAAAVRATAQFNRTSIAFGARYLTGFQFADWLDSWADAIETGRLSGLPTTKGD
jgi:hypothetical protein